MATDIVGGGIAAGTGGPAAPVATPGSAATAKKSIKRQTDPLRPILPGSAGNDNVASPTGALKKLMGA